MHNTSVSGEKERKNTCVSMWLHGEICLRTTEEYVFIQDGKKEVEFRRTTEQRVGRLEVFILYSLNL